MNDTRHDDPSNMAGPGGFAAAPTSTSFGQWWARRPRRSETDRKIAGVAGGLGRAFRVDPVLIRVLFVVLAVFGGFGGLLYVLCWLFLVSDNDEVSAAESLIGRGRSSVAPVLAVGLGVVAVISLFSMFSWGLPFWPLVIAGTIALIVARKHRRTHPINPASSSTAWDSANQRGSAGQWGARIEQHADQFAARAAQWGASAGSWGSRPAAPSPFERPAFWDAESMTSTPGMTGPGSKTPGSQTPGSKTSGMTHPGTPTDLSAPSAPSTSSDPADGPTVADLTAAYAPAEESAPTPPSWDPLGVAPFAWDLPDPEPLAPPAAPPPVRDRGVVGRVTLGATLLVGGLAAIGVSSGWWNLSWAQVSATALAVLAIGLLLGSLRGKGRALIGPGILLSMVTFLLAVTGIDGTHDFGEQRWTPVSADSLQAEYTQNGGQGVLDLSDLELPAGTTESTRMEVRAGHAQVLLPADTAVNLTCSTNVGRIDCAGITESGWRNDATQTIAGDPANGTLNLDVHVGAGFAEVRNG